MTAKPWKITISKHLQNKTRTKCKEQRNRKSEIGNTNFKTVLNQQHHRSQSKNVLMASTPGVQTTNKTNKCT